MERFDKAPPEKMFRKPKSWFEPRKDLNLSASIHGTGMAAKRRNTIKIKRTIKTLFKDAKTTELEHDQTYELRKSRSILILLILHQLYLD